jgi:hypothetical protein
MSIVAVVVALCSVQNARGEDGKLLRWQFRAGDKAELVMTQDVRMKMTVQQRQIETSNTMIMDLGWVVTAVDPQGTATIEQRFERVRMSIQAGPGVKSEYDSASDKKPEGIAAMVAPLFQSMIDKPIVVTMDPQGKAVSVKIPDDVKESIAKTPGGAQMASMLSDEGMKNLMQMATFPEKPVRPGDTWNRATTVKNPMLGDMTVETTWRYVGTEQRGGKELVKITSQIKMQFGEGKEGKAKITAQDNHGTIYFDNQQGFLVENATDSKMTIQVSVQGQQFDQVLENKQTLVRKPAAPSKPQ